MGFLDQWGPPPFGSFHPSFQVDTVRVSTEEMYRKANEVAGQIRTLQELFDQAGQIVARTQGYWIGEAGELHRALMRAREPDIEAILQRLNGHVNQLEQMAANYVAREEQVAAIAGALPADVIV